MYLHLEIIIINLPMHIPSSDRLDIPVIINSVSSKFLKSLDSLKLSVIFIIRFSSIGWNL